MLNLLPSELHQYSLGDMVRGLMAARKPDLAPNLIWPFALGDGIPIRSGRAAIILSIKALGLEPGSRIGVPLYCCPVVFKAIKAADCRPRFLDVDPGTFCISPEDLYAKRSDLDAVVAVHMFGNMCDMGSVQDAMHGKPIIEDCAQALGSSLNDRLAGSMGTIAVFSFRLGKYLSVGEGAAIYTGHSDIRPGAFYNRLMFPIVFSSTKHRDLLRAALKKRGVSAATPYEEAIEDAAKNYGYNRDCPAAERLLKRTLVIPCNHKLTTRDIKHIAQSFNDGWESITTFRGPGNLL